MEWALVVFGVVVLLWVLACVETLATLLLVPAAFAIGPDVVGESRHEGPSRLPEPGRGETPRLRYRVLDTGEVIFRRKWVFFAWQVRTGLDIKGSLERDGGSWTATGRLPVTLLGVYAAYVALFAAGAVVALTSGTPAGAAFPAFLLLVVSVGVWIAVSLERSRFPGMVDELMLGLDAQAAAASVAPNKRFDPTAQADYADAGRA